MEREDGGWEGGNGGRGSNRERRRKKESCKKEVYIIYSTSSIIFYGDLSCGFMLASVLNTSTQTVSLPSGSFSKLMRTVPAMA